MEKYFKAYTGFFFFYTKLYSDNTINFDDKGGGYFKQIRLRGFRSSKREKTFIYNLWFFNSLTKEEKKAVAIVSNAFHITLRKVPGARVFLLQKTTA